MIERKIRALLQLGQSVWLDDLRREMTRSGELQTLVDAGLRGMTSNPTIFEHSIAASAAYEEDLARLSASSKTDREVFETLAIADVREAAELFRGVYDSTNGADGFVSLEVTPDVARDANGSVTEARRLWRAVDRSNVMIKIPGTREAWPAIERCLYEGININITLLFSVEHYQAVADAYMRALEARVALGQPIDRIASVASFFVSRVDTEVDARIHAQGGHLLEFRGQAAIAGAQLAYASFVEMRRSARWQALEAKGARPQRLLWASTGTKNPAYSDVRYVEALIGRDTIATIPPDTLTRFADHGTVVDALGGDDGSNARRVIEKLSDGGIDFQNVNRTLEEEGVKKFAKSLDNVLAAIAQTRDHRRSMGARSQAEQRVQS